MVVDSDGVQVTMPKSGQEAGPIEPGAGLSSQTSLDAPAAIKPFTKVRPVSRPRY